MADLLAQAQATLESWRHQYRTTAVSYRRGGEAVTIQATVGRTDWSKDDRISSLVVWESRDFLVRCEDLVFGGAAVEPQSGDRITEGGKTYEVAAPAGMTAWRHSDVTRLTWRIHTKCVD